MKSAEQELTDFLAPYSPEIRSFAQALRTYLKKETKPAFELVGNSCQSLNIGYGFTTTAWDCYCAIIVYRKHINISLPSGVALSDPESLLHGAGSRIRHLKIKELKDLQTKAARQVLKEARKHALEELGGEEIPAGVQTVIKRGGEKK